MISSVEFQIQSTSVNEMDGSVIVDLIRTGNHSDNITVCIDIAMTVNPAIIQRMYKMCIACVYVKYTTAYAPKCYQ